MKKISWGIIGCGEVAEKKSGPAFQKAPNSELIAVMRRDSEKAKDFASRHKVPLWFDKVDSLLQNPTINSVYIATPPSSHLDICLKAIEAKKDIYLEKPITLNTEEALIIKQKLHNSTSKLCVAHYRRCLPAYLKVFELLKDNAIGDVRFAEIKVLQPIKSSIIADTSNNWRINHKMSGGGYFHDLAPHQIDLMIKFFGEIEKVSGFSLNQANNYEADDMVNGLISFRNGVQFRGIWCFNVHEKDQTEICTIYGSKGTISFTFFGDQILLDTTETSEEFKFETIPHIQQPMIEKVVQYFRGKNENPCSIEDGLKVMQVMDEFCNRV